MPNDEEDETVTDLRLSAVENGLGASCALLEATRLQIAGLESQITAGFNGFAKSLGEALAEHRTDHESLIKAGRRVYDTLGSVEQRMGVVNGENREMIDALKGMSASIDALSERVMSMEQKLYGGLN